MSKKHAVTVVEDDEILRGIYELVLNDAGYDLSLASNGKEGLEVIEKHNPELVLLDLMMPVMDGPTMLKELRSQPWGKKPKVIILTNIGKSELSKELDDFDVHAVLVKVDLTPDQIIQHVEAALK